LSGITVNYLSRPRIWRGIRKDEAQDRSLSPIGRNPSLDRRDLNLSAEPFTPGDDFEKPATWMDPPRRFRRWRENRGEKRTRTRARRGPREQRGPLKRDNARVDAHELRQAPYIRNRAWMARRSRVSLISRDNGEMLIYRGVPSKQAAPACTHSSGENMPCGRERRLCRRWRPLLILHAAKTQRSGHNRISIWSIARRTAGIFARARTCTCRS